MDGRNWKQSLRLRLTSMVWQVESRVDRTRRRLRRRKGSQRPLTVQPYLGFGNSRQARLRGRVLEARDIAPSQADHSVWRNLRSALQRLLSREVAGVGLRGQYCGITQEAHSDEEGYFDFKFLCREKPVSGDGWHSLAITLSGDDTRNAAPVNAKVLVAGTQAAYGIISDLDDTVIKTNATSLVQTLRLTLLHNAHTRVPFEGISAFYQALQAGVGPETFNPILYISSSPWNLYDLLLEFLDVHDIPRGPLLLRDLGIERDRLIQSSHHHHKRRQIDLVMRSYPELAFILVGDSGQDDPDIYRDVALDYPGRIKAIYIRDVAGLMQHNYVQGISESLATRGIEMVLAKDTVQAAQHAAKHGWIDSAALEHIRQTRRRDHDAVGTARKPLS